MKPHVIPVRLLATIALLTVSLGASSQSEEKENQLTLDLQMMTRGEIRDGGLSPDADEAQGEKCGSDVADWR